MSATANVSHEHPQLGFLRTYIFSTDHKTIGKQFLFSSLLFFVLGGLLAMGVRWQLAWPWSEMPIVGKVLFSEAGNQISPEFYNMMFTMHASVMIFFVIIPILAGGFGNFTIPLLIGAEDMAFPKLNMMSYWFMWPAYVIMGASFFVQGGAAQAGWTGYPPLTWTLANGVEINLLSGQVLWLIGLVFVGVSSMMGSINYITTIVNMRAPGMTLFRMPMTIWSLFITAILQAFALPVLTAALILQILDNTVGTSFFLPPDLLPGNIFPRGVDATNLSASGGQPLLWQHMFWFYSHPAVYIMILPAMGMVSDVISTFSRKPLFGYRTMVYSIVAIAGLGFIVWGHHMFMSGMNPALGASFMLATILIALPSAIKTFNWLATLWQGNIQFTAAMLNACAFVSMFIIGGLSGIFMAATPVDIHIHDTYFIVAHLHYVLFGGSIFGIFAGIYYWYPKMFGRLMDERLGKIHFALSFIAYNFTFFPMHLLGVGGFHRRIADANLYEHLKQFQSLNIFITISAFALGIVQLIFAYNFFSSLFFGKKAGRNPWNANSLEWTTPSPAGHGNFDIEPVVYRGPYEFASPEVEEDFLPQTRNLQSESSDESDGGNGDRETT